MEVDLLEKNGQKYRFLHELSIYAICLTRSAAVSLLIRDTWQKVEALLQEITGSIADEECIEVI